MRLLPLFLLFVIVLGVAGVLYFRPLSVTGPEGLDVKIVALDYGGELIYKELGAVGNAEISMWDDKAIKLIHEPDGIPLINCKGQPGICEYGPTWYYAHDGGSLLVEVSRPELTASFTPPNGWKSIDGSYADLNYIKEVEWVNYLPNGTMVKRVGKIIPAEFIIQIASQDRVGYFGLYQWKDTDVWLELYGVYWEPYDPNPPAANSSGYWTLVNQPTGYMVPILTWVKAGTPWLWKDQDGRQVGDYLPHSEMQNWLSFHPDLAGREFTMYYSVGEYYGQIPSREEIIEGNPLKYVAPDPRMTDKVYIHLHIEKYGPYAYTECGGWTPTFPPCCLTPKLEVYYPASYIKVRTLLLVWGEFHYVWTQKEAQEQQHGWENRTTSDVNYEMDKNVFQRLMDSVASFLNSPAGILMLLIIAAAVFLIVGLILMMAGGKNVSISVKR